ncbi:hypothetical protein [Kitasatospora purpeofusca]|uniref:hypothetical protein n=1 Tax=Kitasatospora purpeofusca TaxID=67352 RepID=UPI002A598F40|nr:hypothetical protein [Kitasatospora purpeofusca]MDY0814678.1 hypothetical protein [Kitasatospora purpeofusca]
MTWLRVLTALGILAAAASALLVFALCTAAGRGDRIDRGAPGSDLRSDAERSGLIRRPGAGS